MNVPTIQFEGRLMGYKKTRNRDGDWVELRLQVHPDEASPLNAVALGQRLQCVVVEIGDDEQPAQKPKGGELARRAGILCNDERFQQWAYLKAYPEVAENPSSYDPIGFSSDGAAGWLRDVCHIESRAMLDHDPVAAKEFTLLETEFNQVHGMMAEKR